MVINVWQETFPERTMKTIWSGRISVKKKNCVWSTRWMCKKNDFMFQCWNQKMPKKKKLNQEWLATYFRCVVQIIHRNFTTPDWFHTIHDLYCSAFAHLISGSPVLLPVYCCLQLNLWFRVIYCHLLWRQINNAFGQHSPIKNKLFKLFTFPFDSRC